MRLIKIGTFVVFVIGVAAFANAQTAVNADAATLADFTKRIADYVDLQKKLEATLKEVPNDGRPEDFIDHQRALAKLIQKARASAKQGDVWSKPMRDVVRRLLASTLRGSDGKEIKRSIEDEYTGNFVLKVNVQYPDGTPFSTVPPQVLQGLPKLPGVLEYRFMGKRLILLDSHARIVVDFIEHVFP